MQDTIEFLSLVNSGHGRIDLSEAQKLSCDRSSNLHDFTVISLNLVYIVFKVARVGWRRHDNPDEILFSVTWCRRRGH